MVLCKCIRPRLLASLPFPPYAPPCDRTCGRAAQGGALRGCESPASPRPPRGHHLAFREGGEVHPGLCVCFQWPRGCRWMTSWPGGARGRPQEAATSKHHPSWGGLQVCIPQPGTQKTGSPHRGVQGLVPIHPSLSWSVRFTPNPRPQAHRKEGAGGHRAH